MTVNTSSERTNISARVADDNRLADAEAIDGSGVEQAVGNVGSFTVYLKAQDDTTVTIELSPDGGESWYEMSESPVEMTVATAESETDATVHFNYNASRLRLTADTAATVDAQVREVV